jgi:hypothetical protein
MTDDANNSTGPGRPSAKIVDLAAERKAAEERRRKSKDRVGELVKDLNKQFCVVPEGSDVYVYREQRDPLRKGHWKLNKFTFRAFREFLLNHRMVIDVLDPKKPGMTKQIVATYAEIWLAHPDRRECKGGPIFDPTGKVSSSHWWNLWKGFAVKPVKNPQGWKLMQEHIYSVLAASDRKVFSYILDWSANMLQHPERQGDTSLIFRDDAEGLGKGLFVKALLAILGPHGFHLHHAEQLRGQFNAHLHQLVLLYLDEASWAGDRQLAGYLKGLVSDEEIGIQYKNKDTFQAPNYLHIIISSNEDWVINASRTSRRWVPFRVSDHRRGDLPYFKALAYEIEHGGAEAMAYDLLHRDLSCFDAREYPRTPELDQQRLLSLDVLPRWWMAVLSRGFCYKPKWGAPSLLKWHEFHTTQLLTASHHQWCDAIRWHQRANDSEIGSFMKEKVGYRWTSRTPAEPIGELDTADREVSRYDERQPEFAIGETDQPTPSSPSDWREAAVIRKRKMNGYYMASLEEARAQFKQAMGDLPMPWDPVV